MPRTTKRTVKRRKKSKITKILPLVIVFVAGIIALTVLTSRVNSDNLNAQVPNLVTAVGSSWWNADYYYRQKVSLTGQGKHYIEIDHASLVNKKQSLASGNDLRIIAQIAGQIEEAAIFTEALNTSNTKISFDASKLSNAEWYLYYGNNVALKPSVLGANTVITSTTALATLQEVQTPTLKVESEKNWHIIKNSLASVKLKLTTAGNSDWEWFYSVNNGTKQKLTNPISNELQIDMSNSGEGVQSLALIVKTPDGWLRSNNVNITLAHPIYVAWTIDWEGYDIKDWVLRAAQEMADKYNMPMTHFFNPRIYVASDISDFRKKTLTNWVLARANVYKDEIAMHMHMHYDMIRSAGLEPIRNPYWGSGRDGYDVLTSSYNYDQFKQLIGWGVRKFQEQGLPTPQGYRAGGWFADIENIRALSDYGFTYDSSGRTKYTFGTQKQGGVWDLATTSQPYQLNQSDINSGDDPKLNMWEVPNNGNDSYWFSADQMISNFYSNYDPATLPTSPKMITYMSHFDWFDVDQPKLTQLFDVISQHTLENDAGPVVFVTASDGLNAFK